MATGVIASPLLIDPPPGFGLAEQHSDQVSPAPQDPSELAHSRFLKRKREGKSSHTVVDAFVPAHGPSGRGASRRVEPSCGLVHVDHSDDEQSERRGSWNYTEM